MKKMNRAVTAIAASVVLASVFTLSACGNGYGSSASNEAADKIAANLATQTSQSLSATGTVTAGGNAVDFTANANYATGDMDINLQTGNAYNYMFMRDWDMYGVKSNSKLTDFSNVQLEHITSVKDEIAGELGEAADALLGQASNLINGVLSSFNSFVISFARAANAVAFNGNTLTVDYNLAVYNVFNDFNAVITDLTASTTVGNILGNETIKRYMSVFTELVTVEELNATVDMLVEMINSSAPETPAVSTDEGNTDYPLNPDGSVTDTDVNFMNYVVLGLDELLDVVAPDANSSTYDYIVKLLSSDELVEIINTSVGADVLDKKLTQFTVGELIGLTAETENQTVISQTLAAIKGMFAGLQEYVTTSELKTDNGSVSGFILTYTVDGDYKLLSQTFAITVKDSGNSTSLNASFNYGNTALTLTNISL